MRNVFITALACLLMLSANAQSGTISGKITDSSGKKLLPLTTITVFKAKDTTIITYRLSTDAGEFKIPGLPFDVPLRVMATYSGYEAFRKDFTLSATVPTVNFGTIKMTSTSKQLDEVIVIAERPPVVIKKDTIEFNASAFKTLPTALLEDLLKKLPGIQVDENGDITVNGQKVNRILVDGKRFFGDDPKMATRNLPSNLVDKVQVVDDKDEIAQNNDGDMSKIGKVINLTLKKNIKKALFGKLYGGYGSNDRYEMGGIINTFRDTLQMSVLAFSNNINRSGFSIQDVTQLGGFNRSGFNSMSVYSGGGRDGFAINGISFGGMGNGLTTTTGAGLNLNHSPSKKLSFYGQYFYGGSHNHVVNEGSTQRLFGDTVLTSVNAGAGDTYTNSHTINAGGNWRKDTLNNLSFSGGVTFNTSDNRYDGASATQNNKFGSVSNTSGLGKTNGRNESYNYSISYTHRFPKSKKSLAIYHNVNYTRNPIDNISESVNQYIYPSVSTILVQNFRVNNSPTTSASFSANYSDQLSKNLTLRINERFEYSNQAQLVSVYYKHAASGFYDSLSTTLSNDIRREHTRLSNGLTLSYRVNKVVFNLGASLYDQWINNRFVKGTNSNLHYSNILLNTGFNWKRINVNLSQSVNPPSINYLNPVTDNTNPFYIVSGNPDLRPSRNTNLNVNGSIFNVKSNMNYTFYLSAGWQDDVVIQSISVNSSGVQEVAPVNVNGVKQLFSNIRINKQFKKNPKFIFSADLNLSGNVNQTPMLFNKTMSETSSYGFMPNLRLNFNWHDVVEFNPSAGINLRKTVYTSSAFSTNDYTGQTLQGEFVVRLPKKFVWETNLAYSYISNLAPGLPKSNVYWNAALTMLMFNQDKGQLKFAVYDILNRNNSVNRYINGNAIIDSRTNVLQRYFMLTYSYNIRSLAGQKTKVGGKQSNMFFF
ncbi:MAG: outer membrane beta-barrel protein [Bacteroidota bacterium]